MKCIVTTTIYSPSKATLEFCKKKDWQFIIVGDLKTPHDEYYELEKKHSNVLYMSPEYQEKHYKKLSDAIGWKKIMRRNIGFVEAYNLGAELIATIDDDNIPYEDWGKEIFVDKYVTVDLYEPKNANVFDPLSVTNAKNVWHRGYPIQYVPDRHQVEYKGKTTRYVLMQADLWDGDPDIDAMARLSLRPMYKLNVTAPYCSTTIAPFNSQNTFISREVIPYYPIMPFVGRMDDIWGSFIAQYHFPDSLIFNKATVYQERNTQDLFKNLEDEIFGYRNSYKMLNDLANYETYLTPEALNFYKIYRKQFN